MWRRGTGDERPSCWKKDTWIVAKLGGTPSLAEESDLRPPNRQAAHGWLGHRGAAGTCRSVAKGSEAYILRADVR